MSGFVERGEVDQMLIPQPKMEPLTHRLMLIPDQMCRSLHRRCLFALLMLCEVPPPRPQQMQWYQPQGRRYPC